MYFSFQPGGSQGHQSEMKSGNLEKDVRGIMLLTTFPPPSLSFLFYYFIFTATEAAQRAKTNEKKKPIHLCAYISECR